MYKIVNLKNYYFYLANQSNADTMDLGDVEAIDTEKNKKKLRKKRRKVWDTIIVARTFSDNEFW